MYQVKLTWDFNRINVLTRDDLATFQLCKLLKFTQFVLYKTIFTKQISSSKSPPNTLLHLGGQEVAGGWKEGIRLSLYMNCLSFFNFGYILEHFI